MSNIVCHILSSAALWIILITWEVRMQPLLRKDPKNKIKERYRGLMNILKCLKYCLGSETVPDHLCTVPRVPALPQVCTLRDTHRLNMELDLQSLFGLHMPSCTH